MTSDPCSGRLADRGPPAHIGAVFLEQPMRCGTILLAFSLALLLPAGARAQQPASATMVTGTWRGWVLRPDEDSVRVSFLVEQKGKRITIVLRSPNNPDYGMGDVKLKDDVLTFSWAMGQGSFLLCRLSRRGGTGFDGQCQDALRDSQGGRNRVFMNMVPPRAGSRGEGVRLKPSR